jgi:hypothetical protein
MIGFSAPRTALLAFGCLAAITALLYLPGLAGPFVFDDYVNIVNTPLKDMQGDWLAGLRQATLGGYAGPLGRPISMASFWLNAVFTGMNPFWFKLTNLFIHILNGWLVWRVSRRLIGLLPLSGAARDWLPLAVSGIWLLHPIQLTAVLYVVQRMTSLSATFILLGLLVYLRARAVMVAGRDASLSLWLGVPVCAVLGALAKENGVLLIPFCCAIEISLLRFRDPAPRRWGNLGHFYLAFLVLPLAVVAIFLLSHPDWFAQSSLYRPFSAFERLLTESRVLVFYLRLLLLPSISEYGLFYDDFPVSHSLLDPLTTLFAVGAWLALVTGALLARDRLPLLAFAVCWFLAGHALESSFLPLELVHLHRNYLACLGPLLALTVGIHQASRALDSRGRAAILPGIMLALSVVTALRADQWRDDLTLARFELMHRPNSPRAQYEGGRVLAELAVRLHSPELKENAIEHLRRAAELAPDEISALIGIGIVAEGPFPDDVFQLLKARLQRRAVSPVDINYLRSMMSCRQTTPCQVPPEQIQMLFGIMLNHPKVTPAVTSQLLSLLGLYYASDLGDVKACVRLLREAVDLQPADIQIRLNLAQALLFLPDYAGAEQALAVVEKLDSAGREAMMVRRIRQDLEKMTTAASDQEQR